MKIDVYTKDGKKKGTVDLPSVLFESKIDEGLMHSALIMQQSNRRTPIAHVQQRHDVRASTRKLYRQKGTGRARRGSSSANILRGGAKSFGPRNIRNFKKAMPRKMRRKALFSCLSYAAKAGKIIGLESYGDDHKTKTFVTLLEKLPVDIGRKIVFVLPEHHEALECGAGNVPGVKTILAPYLNPEDILGAYHLVFLVDALKVAESTFCRADRSRSATPKSSLDFAPTSAPGASPSAPVGATADRSAGKRDGVKKKTVSAKATSK